MRVVLPTPAGPDHGPAPGTDGGDQWASSLLRQTSGQLATTKRSCADLLSSWALSWHFLAVRPLHGPQPSLFQGEGRKRVEAGKTP